MLQDSRRDNVTALPAVHCAYNRGGGCLYEQCLNPDYHEGWRCSELMRLSDAYDLFLEQMEHVTLSAEEALQLWRARLERMPAFGEQCLAMTVPDAPANPLRFAGAFPLESVSLGCVFAEGLVCVLKLPQCKGICKHYTLETSVKKG